MRPYDDHGARVSSAGVTVPAWSVPPTVITNGSLAGAPIGDGVPSALPLLPAAATTTTPFSQSCSTALSSGSLRKLVAWLPAIDMLATRMLYVALFASIQSRAAITSLVSDSPCASPVRTSTSGAFWATPGAYDDAPAAMPATIVPWPIWSPVAPAGESDEKSTLATIREPKSAAFVGSMPVSTIAIAGSGGALYAGTSWQAGSILTPVASTAQGTAGCDHSGFAPTAAGHCISVPVSGALSTFNGRSGVTVTPPNMFLCWATNRIAQPGSLRLTPLIRLKLWARP